MRGVRKPSRRLMRGAIAGALALGIGFLPPGPAAAYDVDTPDIVTKNPTYGRGGMYVVQDGDTLWDLCDVFFGQPWYWPTLWSYNPQITNPHWIFPGDLLQMKAPRDRAAGTTIIWSESRFSDKKVDLTILARYVGDRPERPFKESGVIRYARESHDMLGEYDEIYVSFESDVSVKKGQRFTIYRDEGEVEDPESGDAVGHKIMHLGVAKVIGVEKDKYVKALILKSYREIHRGDKLTSIFPHSWDVHPKPNTVDLVASLIDYHAPTTYGGQFNYVYIDKGRVHKVERGNRFLIQRRGDGLWYEEGEEDDDIGNFPWEREGEIMSVEAFEETSLGVVSLSIKELQRGERLVLKKGY